MKKRLSICVSLFLLSISICVLAIMMTSCRHLTVWGGDGIMVVESVERETVDERISQGKYVVKLKILKGYNETMGDLYTDYVIINTDSMFNVGDTLYLKR